MPHNWSNIEISVLVSSPSETLREIGLWIIPFIQKKGYHWVNSTLSQYAKMQERRPKWRQIQIQLLFSHQRSHYYLQAYQALSPELSPFIIKAHSTFEPEGNMMPDSFCVQPEEKKN